MNTGIIATRYAAALLQYATSCRTEHDLYGMMKRISACFTDFQDLEKTFCNRIIPADDRKALFLIIRSVSLGYIDKYRRQQGITHSVLTTVVAVDDLTAEKIKSFLDPVNPQKVELELKQDDRLIGGFSLRVGMKVWDASLLGRLRQVRKAYGLKDIY